MPPKFKTSKFKKQLLPVADASVEKRPMLKSKYFRADLNQTVRSMYGVVVA